MIPASTWRAVLDHCVAALLMVVLTIAGLTWLALSLLIPLALWALAAVGVYHLLRAVVLL